MDVPYEGSLEREFTAAFDGSSVSGFEEIERSDLLLKIDRGTLREVPWAPGIKRSIGTIYRPDKTRFEKDPRYVAERTREYVESLGYRVLAGAELEFFVLRSLSIRHNNPTTHFSYTLRPLERPRPEKNYHSLDTQDPLFTYRMRVSEYMSRLGYGADTSHHEVARSQLELSLRAGDPVYLGDEIVTAKWVARYVASESGLRAVFMPKPIYGENGSGLHIHLSLWRDGENLFIGGDGGLSDTARYFIGGLIEHCRSLAAIVAPTTNSYRRLLPGYEAPVYCLWGRYNRSVAIRVPVATDPSRTRVEFRVPDPASNPYLAVSATIMAGIDGVKKKIDPGDEFTENAYRLGPREIAERGVKVLPASLREALEELESDNEYLRPVFSGGLIESFIEVKKREVEEIEKRPHPYEFVLYIDI